MTFLETLQHKAHKEYMNTYSSAGLKQIEKTINLRVEQVRKGLITEAEALSL